MIIYTLANTLIPGFALGVPAPEFHVRHASEPEVNWPRQSDH